MKVPVASAIIVIFVTVVSAHSEKKPAVFRKWPACKKKHEYVKIVKKDDRIPPEETHERTNRNGKVSQYTCLPCTKCASGVLQNAPCLTYTDTFCSATECALPECVLDEFLSSCRLPGDPNDFPSISDMMDPCDPSKVSPSQSDPSVHVERKNITSSQSKGPASGNITLSAQNPSTNSAQSWLGYEQQGWSWQIAIVTGVGLVRLFI